MTITYKRPFGDRTTRVPIMHKVVYGGKAKEISLHGSTFRTRPRHDVAALGWCESNCQFGWHSSQNNDTELYIEFEDDEEAALFALKWA